MASSQKQQSGRLLSSPTPSLARALPAQAVTPCAISSRPSNSGYPQGGQRSRFLRRARPERLPLQGSGFLKPQHAKAQGGTGGSSSDSSQQEGGPNAKLQGGAGGSSGDSSQQEGGPNAKLQGGAGGSSGGGREWDEAQSSGDRKFNSIEGRNIDLMRDYYDRLSPAAKALVDELLQLQLVIRADQALCAQLDLHLKAWQHFFAAPFAKIVREVMAADEDDQGRAQAVYWQVDDKQTDVTSWVREPFRSLLAHQVMSVPSLLETLLPHVSHHIARCHLLPAIDKVFDTLEGSWDVEDLLEASGNLALCFVAVSSPLNLAFLEPRLNHMLRKLACMLELEQGIPYLTLSFGAKKSGDVPEALQHAMQGFLLVILQRVLADAKAGKGGPLQKIALEAVDLDFLRSLPSTEIDAGIIAALNKLCFDVIRKEPLVVPSKLRGLIALGAHVPPKPAAGSG